MYLLSVSDHCLSYIMIHSWMPVWNFQHTPGSILRWVLKSRRLSKFSTITQRWLSHIHTNWLIILCLWTWQTDMLVIMGLLIDYPSLFFNLWGQIDSERSLENMCISIQHFIFLIHELDATGKIMLLATALLFSLLANVNKSWSCLIFIKEQINLAKATKLHTDSISIFIVIYRFF